MVLMVLQMVGDRAASFLAPLAAGGTFLHLGIVVLVAFVGAELTSLGARKTCETHHRALARHQLAQESAELLAVDGQLSGHVVLLVPVLDVFKAIVECLIAHHGALVASLQAIAVSPIVMVRMLGKDLTIGQGGEADRADANGSQDLPSVHHSLLWIQVR
jgi:hypothetical protein